MNKFKLPRLKQCENCPWKVSTDPNDIPDGYSVEKHRNLSCTIAKSENMFEKTNNMACHYSNGQDGMYCIGWLNHQLGRGNNLGLRMSMMNCENISKIQIVGEQHERFEDTLPD